MKPQILIPIPTSTDSEYNRSNWPVYAEAVRMFGGAPVRWELSSVGPRALLAGAAYDGILLPGSPADVNPVLYGQVPGDATAAADVAREDTDRNLLEEAWETGKPLLAVCFGMQMMNVWQGGTLIQNLLPIPVNHAAGRQVLSAHAVTVAEHAHRLRDFGMCKPAYGGEAQRFLVNSSHHQAVGIPGSGLRVCARSSEDQVIEALEREDEASFFLGVQWHPERTVATSLESRSLFEKFIEAAAEFAGSGTPGAT